MNLSRNADFLLEELAQHYDHPNLAFDDNGMIPILLNEEVEIAIAYSPNNDAFVVFGIVDPAPEFDSLDWRATFQANAESLERRTRLSLDDETGCLVIEREIWVDGLHFADLMNALDAFIGDLARTLYGDSFSVPHHEADAIEACDSLLLWL